MASALFELSASASAGLGDASSLHDVAFEALHCKLVVGMVLEEHAGIRKLELLVDDVEPSVAPSGDAAYTVLARGLVRTGAPYAAVPCVVHAVLTDVPSVEPCLHIAAASLR